MEVMIMLCVLMTCFGKDDCKDLFQQGAMIRGQVNLSKLNPDH